MVLSTCILFCIYSVNPSQIKTKRFKILSHAHYANWLLNKPNFSNRATTAYNIKMIQGNYDLDYNTVKH